jgi:hypothetical protein
VAEEAVVLAAVDDAAAVEAELAVPLEELAEPFAPPLELDTAVVPCEAPLEVEAVAVLVVLPEAPTLWVDEEPAAAEVAPELLLPGFGPEHAAQTSRAPTAETRFSMFPPRDAGMLA